MKQLSAILLGLALGCAHVESTSANLERQADFGIVKMGQGIAYVMDPRTESCLLIYIQAAATRVDCRKLKKNVPEAAKYITWEGE